MGNDSCFGEQRTTMSNTKRWRERHRRGGRDLTRSWRVASRLPAHLSQWYWLSPSSSSGASSDPKDSAHERSNREVDQLLGNKTSIATPNHVSIVCILQRRMCYDKGMDVFECCAHTFKGDKPSHRDVQLIESV